MGHLKQFVFTHLGINVTKKDLVSWPKNSCLYCENCPCLMCNLKKNVLYVDCEIWDADPIEEGCKGTCKYFKEENKNV